MSTPSTSGSNATKPSKKARTSAKAQPAVGTKSTQRSRKRLPSLHEMPFDIFLEILLQIDPKGLVNLARTSKDTRRALVNKNMDKVVWKAVREDCKALDPPPGWSEAKWVCFLFSSFCYSCGKGNATIDFYILKRLCIPCKKAGCIRSSEIDSYDWNEVQGECLYYDEAILHTDYRESTRKGGDCRYEYYWSADVEESITAWNTMCAKVTAGVANSMEELLRFKREKAEYVHVVHLCAAKMMRWEAVLQLQRTQELASNKTKLVDGIRQRFIGLNVYTLQDIDEAINMKTTGICGSMATEVTNRTWKTWRSKLEPIVIKARDARASLNIPMIEILAHPALRDIWYLPQVIALREADPETALTPESYQAVVDEFPTIVSTFVANKKDELRRMLPEYCNSSSDSPVEDPFELAVSVFIAPTDPNIKLQGADGPFPIGDSCVLGWKGLSVCHCTVVDAPTAPDTPTPGLRSVLPVFNAVLSGVARSLVLLCGLDPQVATMDDMNRVDERFVCGTCAKRPLACADRGVGQLVSVAKRVPGSTFSMQVFTWRQALQHARTCGDDRLELIKLMTGPVDLHVPSFRKLADLRVPSARELVDSKEEDRDHPLLADLEPAWFCNHCPDSRGFRKGTIDEHMKTRHPIREPVLDKDYFQDPVRISSWTCILYLPEASKVPGVGVE